MGKSRPRSRSNRSTRERRVARARATRAARHEAFFDRAVEDRFEEIFGDGVPPSRSAELMLGSDHDRMSPPRVSLLFLERSSVERARAVVAEALRQAPGSAAALSLAADLAAAIDGDQEGAVALLGEIPEEVRAAQPVVLAGHFISAGRTHAALDILDAHLADEPGDRRAEILRAKLLETMHAALTRHACGDCGCGPGQDCRQQADADAVARFEDRSAIYALRQAMLRLTAADPVVSRAMDEAVAHWHTLSDGPGIGYDAAALMDIATEHAWLVAGDEDSDDDADAPIRVLAETAADASLRTAAQRWHEHLQYGLWQVGDPAPGPGVWLTDLSTGRAHYAAVAAEQLEGTARWTVLLGALVAIDGVWRTTRTLIPLRPGEGDELAELAGEMLVSLVSELSGEEVSRPRRGDRPEPTGVLIAETEPAEPALADLQSRVIGAGMQHLLCALAELRAASPRMTNTDGDPLVLIEATVAVRDPQRTLAALAAHADFEADGDTVTWYGRKLDALEQETTLAELREHLRAQGESAEVGEADAPERWIRGTIAAESDGLRVQVNSRKRFDKLLGALRDAGGEPEVQKRTVIDPAQDLAPIRTGSMPAFAGSQGAHDAWVAHWPDQPIPALGGKTPRRAARDRRERPHLEALLREFEHDADLLRGAGRDAPDITALRRQLGMSE